MLTREMEPSLKLSDASAAIIYRSIIQWGQWVNAMLDLYRGALVYHVLLPGPHCGVLQWYNPAFVVLK